MSKVLAISEKELAKGFALAGLETWMVSDAKEASEALAKIISGGEYGIVIMDEKLSSELDKQVKTALSRSQGPMLVSIPAELRWRDTERLPHDDCVARLIRRAVGYQLNIKL
ncbi:MAG: V-type ATP synthase subunit F [Sedimentisphaerales bacterium]